MHLTETCEDDAPCLITHVATSAGPVVDAAATPVIHDALERRDLLPAAHIVDTGSLDAALLVASAERYGVDLLGPPRPDSHWQARAQQGFAAHDFQIDWAAERATCPAGHASISWTPAVDNRRNEVVKIKFSAGDCRRCPFLTQCVRSTKTYPRRALTVRRQPQYEALAAARQRQQTPEYARVRPTCRCRGHAVARRASLPPAPHALCRTGPDPPWPCPHRRWPEFPAAGRVAQRQRPAQDAPLSLRHTDGRRRPCLTVRRLCQQYQVRARATNSTQLQVGRWTG